MTGTAPRWLEQLLNIPPAATGQGTLWTLEFAWPWSSGVTLLAVALAVALVAYCYHRETGTAGRGYRLLLAGLRLAVLALVAAMLGELTLAVKRTGLPTVVVAIDDSRSMSHVDQQWADALAERAGEIVRAAGLEAPTRLNIAKGLLLADDGATPRELEREYTLKVYYVGEDARAQGGGAERLLEELPRVEAKGEETRLGASIRRILDDLRGAPPTAIVLFTDGVNTAGEPLDEAAEHARREGVPLFTVGIGDTQPAKDVVLNDVLAPEVVFVGDTVRFTAQLTSSGFDGESVELTLRDRDRAKPLASVEAKLEAGAQQVVMSYQPPEEGVFEFVVEARPLPGEERSDNNSVTRRVVVRDQVLRLLYVQSAPSFEYRYLKHMLERVTIGESGEKKAFELHTLLQESDIDHALQDATALRVFPVEREELFAYDCILFGDVNPDFLGASSLEAIHDFVTEKGGGLVVIAGPRYTPLSYQGTPLARLLPVSLEGATTPLVDQPITEGFKVEPTPLGLSIPSMQLGDTPEETRAIWESLPELYWMMEAPNLKPAARVLAEHPTRRGADGRKLPLFTMQYVGAGEVLFHATDETRLWRARRGDELFQRYWVQMIRYLSRGRLLSKDQAIVLSTDRREYRQGEPVRLQARFVDARQSPEADDGVTVVLERPGQEDQQIVLRRRGAERGVFEATAADLTAGAYHGWVVEPLATGAPAAVDFRVVAPPGENAQLEMDVAALESAAKLTGGKFYTFDKASDILRDLPRGAHAPMASLPSIPLWNQWPMVALFLVLVCTEWILRKRRGML